VAHWDVPPDWDVARRTGYQPTAYAEVWQNGGLVTTLDVTGGSVTCDETSKVRRTLSLPSANVELTPKDAGDLLAPFGTELRVYAGMTFTSITEVVPVGVFQLETVTREGWYGDLLLTGFDRAGVLAEARFLQPWNTLDGNRVVDEIAAMILAVLPSVEVYDLTGSDAVTRAAAWDRDRWDAITNLAQGIGAEVFFDQAGRAIIRPVTTVADLLAFGQTPVNVYANAPDADLLEVTPSMSRTDVYNAVVATSDQTTTPVMAIAYQATGPMAWRTGFQKPRFFATPVVTSYDGIAAAAASILAKSLAYSRAMPFDMIPDARLDAGSLVALTTPDNETVYRILSTFSVPLGTGAMSVQTRLDGNIALATDGSSLA
jgi:hypothetical protein